MKLTIEWISTNLVEIEANDVNSGVLNAKEAKELALNLIEIASELLQVCEPK
jgi:hypothetical protein